MIEKIHLPEDLGDTPAKAGAKPITQSYSFVLASDDLVGYASVFPPVNDAEKFNPIYKPASENTTDVFALTRQIQSNVLFRNVSNYDLELNQWSFQLADSTEGGALPQGAESIIWTERINTVASYPGSLSDVKFLPQLSGIQLINYPVSSNIGYQQTVLYSNRLFSASVSPILVTFAVSMTLSDNPNCSKTWGLFGGTSGYFFRIYGSGSVDNFVVGYKNTLGSVTKEVEIKRSDFTGDKLDGSGGHTQTFTNVGMFGIEIGTAGFGARFWAYVTISASARWVLVHSLYNDSDSSQDRITDEEALPISFEILNKGASTSLQTLTKYGCSVTSLGDSFNNTEINSQSSTVTVSVTRSPMSLMGLRLSDFINGKKNFTLFTASKLSVVATAGLWQIVIIKNPSLSSSNWVARGEIQYNLDKSIFTNGDVLARFYVGTKPITVSLENIFNINRVFGSSKYTQIPAIAGDFGQQFFIASDAFWVCAVNANIPETIWNSEIDIAWEGLTACQATYENATTLTTFGQAATINISLLYSHI